MRVLLLKRSENVSVSMGRLTVRNTAQVVNGIDSASVIFIHADL